MTIITLEDILSREEVARISERVAAALATDKTAVLVGGGEILATVMGPQAIRDAIHNRVLTQLVNNPDELNRLQERFESDDLVE